MKHNNRCSRFQISALAIAGLLYSLQAVAMDYTITGLGTSGGTENHAIGINNYGQVLGLGYSTGRAAYHGFVYSGDSYAEPLNGNTMVSNSLILRNNIVEHGTRKQYEASSVDFGSLAPGSLTKNIWCNSTASSKMGDTALITGDPMFVTPGADFHIQTSSSAKDSDVNTGAFISGYDWPIDYDLTRARPHGSAYDIVAYEFH